jgi:hypothetical protein
MALTEPPNEAWERAWTVTERLIAEIATESRRHEVPFLLTSIGCDFQIHPDAALTEPQRRTLAGSDLGYSDRRLQRLGSEHGFPVIPLAEPMRRYAAEHGIFLHGFPNTQLGTGHWNAEGHRVAGQIVAGALCDGWRHLATTRHREALLSD